MRRVGRLLVLAAVLTLPAQVASGSGASPPRPLEAVTVPTGPAPCGAAAGAGSLWIGVYGSGTLLRIDGRGRVEERIRVGPTPCRVAVGRSAVWVTLDRPGMLARIGIGTGRRQRVRVGAGAFDVLLTNGSAWATSFDAGTLTRVDSARGEVTRVLEVGANPAGLALCGGRIWIGHGGSATSLTSLDPSTLRVRRVPVGAIAPAWPARIRGAMWVTTPDTVLRVDPRAGRVLSRLRIGDTLADAAAAPDGLVWVTDKQHSEVLRVERGGRSVVDRFPAGPGAFALARLGGSMWVTSFAGSDVRRFDP